MGGKLQPAGSQSEGKVLVDGRLLSDKYPDGIIKWRHANIFILHAYIDHVWYRRFKN